MGGRSAWPDLAGGAAKPGGWRLGVARPRRGLLGRALAAAARLVLAGRSFGPQQTAARAA